MQVRLSVLATRIVIAPFRAPHLTLPCWPVRCRESKPVTSILSQNLSDVTDFCPHRLLLLRLYHDVVTEIASILQPDLQRAIEQDRSFPPSPSPLSSSLFPQPTALQPSAQWLQFAVVTALPTAQFLFHHPSKRKRELRTTAVTAVSGNGEGGGIDGERGWQQEPAPQERVAAGSPTPVQCGRRRAREYQREYGRYREAGW